MKKPFVLEPLERAIVVILGLLHAGVGLYYGGPWYISETSVTPTGEAPSSILFQGEPGVSIYGIVLTLNGLALLWIAARNSKYNNTGFFTNPIAIGHVVLTGFLLRLYFTIGNITTIESLLPPSWASRVATVALAGALWLRVKYRARVTTE